MENLLKLCKETIKYPFSPFINEGEEVIFIVPSAFSDCGSLFSEIDVAKSYSAVAVVDLATILAENDISLPSFLQKIRKILESGGKLLITAENPVSARNMLGVSGISRPPFAAISDNIPSKKEISYELKRYFSDISVYGLLPHHIFITKLYNEKYPITPLEIGSAPQVYPAGSVLTAREDNLYNKSDNPFSLLPGYLFAINIEEQPLLSAFTPLRKSDFQITTTLYNDRVIKKAKNIAQIENIIKNEAIIKSKGLRTLDSEIVDGVYTQKRSVGVSFTEHLYDLVLQGSREGFITEIKRFYSLIKKLPTLYDLTFDNVFIKSNEFEIIDQEWSFEVSALFVLYRSITRLYIHCGNSSLEQFIPLQKLLSTFGIEDRHEFDTLEGQINGDIVNADLNKALSALHYSHERSFSHLLELEEMHAELERHYAEMERQRNLYKDRVLKFENSFPYKTARGVKNIFKKGDNNG